MIRELLKNNQLRKIAGVTIVLGLGIVMLVGCSSTPVKEVVIKTKPIEIEIAQPERPREVKLERF